jgi:hypothetical protein
MRRTEAPYDDKWAIARLHEVWEWAVAQKRPFVAYLIGMTILSFDIDEGRGTVKPPRKPGDKPGAAKGSKA